MKTFRPGRSTYNCDICKRLTRETGAQSIGSHLCPQCWDLAGLENEISDGMETVETYKDNIVGIVKELEAKGGDVSDWIKTFPTIFTEQAQIRAATVAQFEDEPYKSDEDIIVDLLMSRSTEELERSRIQELTMLREERCYNLLRRLVANGKITQRMHTGTTNGRPVRVARYQVAR